MCGKKSNFNHAKPLGITEISEPHSLEQVVFELDSVNVTFNSYVVDEYSVAFIVFAE